MKHRVIDQMNRNVELPVIPQRIVSLVPSQTELLYYLGLNEQVVGQTLFCIHPAWAHREKPRVGGTKKLNIDKIRELKPDLIIGNKEENLKAQIELLATEFPVWMSDIHSLDDALEMIGEIGVITGTREAAQKLQEEIRARFDALAKPGTPQRVAYLIWNEPMMAAGHDTFITDMLHRAGFENVFGNLESRYPEITAAQFQAAKPDLIFLSSEPFPFVEKHLEQYQEHNPQAKVLLVDGERFSWYGNRLLETAPYLAQLQQTAK